MSTKKKKSYTQSMQQKTDLIGEMIQLNSDHDLDLMDWCFALSCYSGHLLGIIFHVQGTDLDDNFSKLISSLRKNISDNAKSTKEKMDSTKNNIST